METLVLPLRNADQFLLDAYEQLFLSGRIRLISISQSMLRQAANLHAATALSVSCNQFFINDKGFRNVPD
jgi:hypothetical protein